MENQDKHYCLIVHVGRLEIRGPGFQASEPFTSRAGKIEKGNKLLHLAYCNGATSHEIIYADETKGATK